MIALLMFVFSKLEFEAEKMEILREGSARVTHLVGGVHLYDSKLDIKGAQAWFAPSENSLIVVDSLKIVTQGVDITADSLRFDTENQISYLHKRVVVTKDKTEIKAPQLVINHRTRKASIPYGVQIRDKEEGILVTGDDAVYDLEANEGSILRNPGLTDEKDSTSFNIRSKRMHLSQKNETASAAEDVKVFTGDATVSCDTLILYYNKDEGYAFGKTSIRNTDGVISSDSAHFYIAERKINEISLYPSVRTKYRTEGEDSVVLTSPALDIDLSVKNSEKLIFSGGVNGTYYWKEKKSEEE